MNDYWLGNLYDEPEKTVKKHMDGARSLSLSLLYWLQTEAPTHDGKSGYPGFRLRGDVNGTKDGLAMRPYIRESRRIKAIAIGKPLKLSPAFPPLHTGHATFTASGVPSIKQFS